MSITKQKKKYNPNKWRVRFGKLTWKRRAWWCDSTREQIWSRFGGVRRWYLPSNFVAKVMTQTRKLIQLLTKQYNIFFFPVPIKSWSSCFRSFAFLVHCSSDIILSREDVDLHAEYGGWRTQWWIGWRNRKLMAPNCGGKWQNANNERCF